MRLLRLIVLVMSFVFSGLASSADAPSTPIAGAGSISVSSTSGISAKVDEILRNLHSNLAAAGANMVPMGKALLLAFMGIAIPWLGIKWALGGDRSIIIGETMELLLKWGVAAWLLRDYASWGGWISSGFDTVIATFGGTASSGAVQTLISVAMNTLAGIWGVIGEGAKTVTWYGDGLGTFIVFTILMAVVAIVAIRSFIVAALYVLAASAFFDLLWMLGPLFIPFIIGWIFSPMFQNWVNMVVMAGLYKVVAVGMIIAIGAILGASGLGDMNSIAKTQATFFSGTMQEPSINLLAVLVVIFFALVIEYLAKQIPTIASGLVGIRGVDVGAMSAGGAMGRGAMAGARGIQGMRDKAGQALQNAMGQGGRQDKEAAMRQRIGTLYQGGQASTTASPAKTSIP